MQAGQGACVGGSVRVTKKPHLAVILVCLSAAVSFGGAITSTTTAVGSSYTSVIGNSNVSASDLTNSFVLVNFSDGSQASCFFGNGTGSCINGGKFSLINTPPNHQTKIPNSTPLHLK